MNPQTTVCHRKPVCQSVQGWNEKDGHVWTQQHHSNPLKQRNHFWEPQTVHASLRFYKFTSFRQKNLTARALIMVNDVSELSISSLLPWFAWWIPFIVHVTAYKETHSMTKYWDGIRDQNTSNVLSLIGTEIYVESLTESHRESWQLQARADEINL